MKKFIYLLAILICFGVVSCGDDKEETVVPPADTFNQKNGDSNNSDNSLPEETAKFVGKWAGRGPLTTYSGAIKSISPGVWTFNSDGTFHWSCSPISGYVTERSGEWHYNSELKMIITNDPPTNTNWKILEVTNDIWTGEASFGGSQTYSRIKESD